MAVDEQVVQSLVEKVVAFGRSLPPEEEALWEDILRSPLSAGTGPEPEAEVSGYLYNTYNTGSLGPAIGSPGATDPDAPAGPGSGGGNHPPVRVCKWWWVGPFGYRHCLVWERRY